MLQTETGALRKMRADLASDGTVNYRMVLGDQEVELNSLIGKRLTLNFSGYIDCQHCGRKIKKSYSQGYCYPCMQKLAQCDMCIMKPETCHFEQGTCREPEWGESNCMIPHYVYLANTSGLKVGITRHTQIPTRWIDQGATQALPIFKVSTRLQSGLVEIALAEFIADKTNWRAMLKGSADALDLKAIAEELKPKIAEKLASVSLKYGADAVIELDESVVDLHFPVKEYLTKISSFNFDKTPEVSGVLLGIKGQYLIFETGVINLRKFTSYHVNLQVS
ncbi:DUF2797 domain-containing protein [Cognaticolwellia beringensis]|uniref:DUF2797 domain-containing protein n=2 Tax=Cognaticolwellia beringensis TaxID=1967665 RepID=A0A222G339_9GAMM|nr:DUF2797 domain-containing protein [Cognaticolwellia beringensis]ASP46348.1 DUF2797 domain-containing protein [Cognaticolwellia beringensis]